MTFLVISGTAFSQTFNIEGKVKDEQNKPVEFANILLLNTVDSTYLSGTTTDSTGYFKLTKSQGEYLLKIQFVGYRNIFQEINLSKDISLNTITIEPDAITLGEVTVSAVKPVVKREIDRIVFDVSNSPSSVGGNALDVMRNVPGLIVGKNSLQIFGKGGVKIYINDRENKLSGSELIDYLRSYSAAEIAKIEVITTPPAKYDAEGNAGIINIRLKARKKDYIGGSLSSGYSLSTADSYGYSGINLNFSKNRVSAFLNTSANYGYYSYIERNEKFYTEMTRNSYTNIKDRIPGENMEGGVDIALNNKWTIGLQGAYNKSEPTSTLSNETDIFSLKRTSADSTITSKTKRNYLTNRGNFNFHIDKVFDEKGKKMLFDIDYLNFQRNGDESFRSFMNYPNGDKIPQNNFDYDNNRTRSSDVFSSKLDFNLPFKSFTMNVGGKMSFTDTKNQIIYDNSQFIYAQNDRFLYTENIYALYADFNKKFNPKLTIKLGLRMEYTYTKGDSKSENQVNEQNYTRLFPTGYLLYNLNEKHVFNLNFSNRIARPAANMINPFTTYENEYSSYRGKADLQPYYTYNAELGYTYKNNLNFGVFYSYADNVFTQLTTLDSVNFTSSTIWDNYITNQTAGIRGSYTFTNDWLQSYIDQRINYQKSISHSPVTPPEGSGWIYSVNLNNTFYLNKSKTFIGELSGSYTSKQYRNTSVFEPTYGIDAGLMYSFLDNKLNVSFNVYDIVYSNMKGEMTSNGMKMLINNTFSRTMFKIGISYNFGKNITTKKRTYSNSDVQQRL